MANLQEQLARASAVARLDEIISNLRSCSDVQSPHREWLVELLLPWTTGQTAQSLVSACRTQMQQFSPVVYAMCDRSNFQEDLASLTRLMRQLRSSEPLEPELGQFARDLAKDMRTSLLRGKYRTSERLERKMQLA